MNTEITKGLDTIKLDPSQVVVGDDYYQFLNCPAIIALAGTPVALSIIPGKTGDIYIDTALSKVYIAKAATAATDRLILN